MNDVENVLLDSVEIEVRLRRADPDAVARLAASMAVMGLQTPITVRLVAIPGEGGQNDYRTILVAGLHRIEAARMLGWSCIDAVVWKTGTERDARLWEIAENLHRADLSMQERMDQIAEWVRLTEEKSEIVSAQLEPKLSKRGRVEGRPEAGVKAAARDLGIDRNEAQRAVKIAAIAPEAKAAAAEAGVKTQSGLLEVAKEQTPERQVAKARELGKRVADRKLVQKAGDEIVQRDASDDAAQMLIDFIPELRMTELLGYLDASGALRVTKAIRRAIKTGERVGSDAGAASPSGLHH